MDGKRQYLIEINGIQQSIDAVDSLNKQLNALEKRIDALAKKNINISSSGGGNRAALDEEAKMLQKINELHQKVAASEKAEYQELLHAKEELKEYQTIAKSIAAQTNLDQGINNTKTMQGMKAQLHDIKAAMQTLDVESDKFKQLQQEANELNTKLKEIEQGYGVFGRNVGNYANGVAEGMSKIVIKVGETEREFNNAREASRTLNMELKNMALNGQQNTQEYKDLNDAVKEMNSTLKDVEKSSVAMDNLLDTMQGLTAIASAGQGLAALFGLDDTEIEKSIQKLVALQNVLQGLETIRKQMQTQEGIGMLLSRGNKAVDSLVKSIVGVGTASKGATIAVKALSTALKGIGIGLVIAAVSLLVTKISDWVEKQEEAKKKAEELRKEENKLNATLQVQKVQLQNTLTTLERFNGSQKEEQAIVKDLNSKYGQALGTYKTIAEWKDVLKQKTDAYIESLKLEAQMQSLLKQLEDAYIKQREAQNYQVGFWEGLFEGAGAVRTRVKAQADQVVKELEDAVTDMAKKIDDNNKKHQINMYSPQATTQTKNKIKDDGKKIEDAVRQAQNNINDLKLKLMRDGLAKQLVQLDEENRREIDKIKKNGQKVEEQLSLQAKIYAEQRKKIFDDYRKETQNIIDDNTIREVEVEIERLNRTIEDELRTRPVFVQPVSSSGLENILGFGRLSEAELKDKLERISTVMDAVREKEIASATNDYTKYFQNLIDFMRNNYMGTEEMDKFLGMYGSGDKEDVEKAFEYAESLWKNYYDDVYGLAMRYGDIFETLEEDTTQVLSKSLDARMNNELTYNEIMLKLKEGYIKDRLKLEQKAASEEQRVRNESIVIQTNQLETEIEELKKKKSETTNEDDIKALDEQINALSIRYQALLDEQSILAEEFKNKLIAIERQTNDTIRDITEKSFESFTNNMWDYLTEMDKLESKQPTYDKLGFINVKETKKQFEEIKNAGENLHEYLEVFRRKLESDFEEGLISPEARVEMERDLNSLEISINTRLDSVKGKLKELPLDLAKQIQEVFQIVGQAATQIIQSIGDINEAAFEKQLEAIERQTEELEKQLDKQRDLTQKYKDDVDSIEDELANSRGDRRQHLIDQLNAQMAAQRESLAQEKRIEKEQEKLDERRKKLEYDNEMRKWNQSKLTAAINAALAISAAAVNNWPIPAVPMIAAATAVGAAQMAAIIANKPRKYADGGLLQGKSHRQGGIPVGNTGIEVEGHEYIINKRTSMQNLDMLDLINSKKRRMTLDDFIDFYSKGSKVGKSVSSLRSRFEDGGQLPTLRTDITLNDRLINTMERYAERPTVVEVVDIINKTEDVKRTQVLAGLI